VLQAELGDLGWTVELFPVLHQWVPQWGRFLFPDEASSVRRLKSGKAAVSIFIEAPSSKLVTSLAAFGGANWLMVRRVRVFVLALYFLIHLTMRLQVNQEMTAADRGMYAAVDLVLCKSDKAVEAVVQFLGPDARSKTMNIGWDTPGSKVDEGRVGVVSYESFAHFAGFSKLKGTQAVINAWLAHPGLAHLDGTLLCI
jgi:hypothetical protein